MEVRLLVREGRQTVLLTIVDERCCDAGANAAACLRNARYLSKTKLEARRETGKTLRLCRRPRGKGTEA